MHVGAGLRQVANIDWDLAMISRHVRWQYVGRGPGMADVVEASRRMRMVCDAYG